jgi:hypothetical protein
MRTIFVVSFTVFCLFLPAAARADGVDYKLDEGFDASVGRLKCRRS